MLLLASCHSKEIDLFQKQINGVMITHDPIGFGSGLLLPYGNDLYVLTVYHVVRNKPTPNINIPILNKDKVAFDYETLPSQLLAYNENRDIALLKISLPNNYIDMDGYLPTITNFRKDSLNIGEDTFSIGVPADGYFLTSVIKGNIVHMVQMTFVNEIGDIIGTENPVYINMVVYPGSSGSAVYDTEGNLIGIVRAYHQKINQFAFIVNIDDIVQFLQDTDYGFLIK